MAIYLLHRHLPSLILSHASSIIVSERRSLQRTRSTPTPVNFRWRVMGLLSGRQIGWLISLDLYLPVKVGNFGLLPFLTSHISLPLSCQETVLVDESECLSCYLFFVRSLAG